MGGGGGGVARQAKHGIILSINLTLQNNVFLHIPKSPQINAKQKVVKLFYSYKK